MRNQTSFTVILFFIGFMLAVQFNTVQQPDAGRDTRETWEIQQAIAEERAAHSAYLAEIEALHATVDAYTSSSTADSKDILEETVSQLQTRAGLERYEGAGVAIVLEPAPELVIVGNDAVKLQPRTLYRLVNELYRYGGESIEIAGERLVQTSAIRYINDVLTVNSEPLVGPPYTINVATASLAQAQQLIQRLQVSPVLEALYVDGFSFTFEQPSERIVLQPYTRKLPTDELNEQGGM